MSDDQAVSRLLGMLYAAPTSPERWVDFLRATCSVIGAENAALIGHDVATREHRLFGSLGDSIPAEGADLYADRYWEYDEWTRRGLPRLGAGRVVIGTEVWPKAEFFQSVFYNEFLKQFDICFLISVGTRNLHKQFEVLSIYRGHADQDFDPMEVAILEMLSPHLQNALAMRRRLAMLETRIADFENALNLIESALVLLNEVGRVVFVNAAANAVLGQNSGLRLNKSRLEAHGVAEAATLRDLIGNAAATAKLKGLHGGGAMSVPRADSTPLHLMVSPLRSEDVIVPGAAVVAVFLSDSERHPAVPEEVLRTLFGLTAAEARLAIYIFDGHSLSEAAELNCVSRETVKSQIASVFQKTGARRQSELVRLLARLPLKS